MDDAHLLAGRFCEKFSGGDADEGGGEQQAQAEKLTLLLADNKSDNDPTQIHNRVQAIIVGTGGHFLIRLGGEIELVNII